MSHKIDLTGQTFGRLKVISEATQRSKDGRLCWDCLCECGNKATATGKSLRNGTTRSCGCLVKKHGKTNSRVYSIWRSMKKRCLDPNHDSYIYYGGRGIKLCDRWLVFENFLADMGEPVEGESIDRKDSDGNYEPNNCRWANQFTQNNNKGEYNKRLVYQGKSQTLSEWAREMGCKTTALTERLRRGWSVERTLSTPVKSVTKNTKWILTFDDKTLPAAEWEKITGIPNDVIRQRIKMGWAADRILSTPVRRAAA